MGLEQQLEDTVLLRAAGRGVERPRRDHGGHKITVVTRPGRANQPGGELDSDQEEWGGRDHTST